ncbi:MAG: hypothetical protein FJW69_07950 [Actinobacteria bacterium]|nr:hypothetical protein [Actinomycetota bacterium]MBM3712789.1 hypothetical protein [Actinomycetota bacterium]
MIIKKRGKRKKKSSEKEVKNLLNTMEKNCKKIRKYPSSFFVSALFSIILSCFFLLISLSGCRNYDNKFDIAYFFKTEPEQTALDFMYSMNNHDAEYIYSNLLLDRDRRNISREKFLREFSDILSDVESIEVKSIVYLGYENGVSKVVIEFDVNYLNDSISSYKKYIYLEQENNRWKIVFDKTFI